MNDRIMKIQAWDCVQSHIAFPDQAAYFQFKSDWFNSLRLNKAGYAEVSVVDLLRFIGCLASIETNKQRQLAALLILAEIEQNVQGLPEDDLLLITVEDTIDQCRDLIQRLSFDPVLKAFVDESSQDLSLVQCIHLRQDSNGQEYFIGMVYNGQDMEKSVRALHKAGIKDFVINTYHCNPSKRVNYEAAALKCFIEFIEFQDIDATITLVGEFHHPIVLSHYGAQVYYGLLSVCQQGPEKLSTLFPENGQKVFQAFVSGQVSIKDQTLSIDGLEITFPPEALQKVYESIASETAPESAPRQ
ncbi:hypothetical protein [Candidatus Synchoanobacter obligatus]|uniref:Uncharacterized protein n=1 Tax=Candidatus Synchoanobacter obligatus TaxID=2919597 RepID=A0ABT1L5U9_9GAMM|nr:hypothetical protein [Candidatus Synchoanobacter obligatus]MCP8352311.1 hypothetical protein [Candidatus Synchoanobacter obligatus]